MATKRQKWVPAEPEAPDSDGGVVAECELDAGGLSDARVSRLVIRSAIDAELVRVAADRVEASGCMMAGVSIRDATIDGGDASNSGLTGASVRRVRGAGIGAVGIDFSGARLEDVVLTNCKLRLARGFEASMARCRFEDCDLREAEFEGARLDRVVFRRCDMTAARLAGVDLSGCDLRGSRVEGLVVSPERLAGVRVDATQLPTFAAALGLVVDDPSD